MRADVAGTVSGPIRQASMCWSRDLHLKDRKSTKKQMKGASAMTKQHERLSEQARLTEGNDV